MIFKKLNPYIEATTKMTVHTARLTVIQLMTCVREDPNVKASTATISVPTRIGASSAKPGIPYRSHIRLDLVSFLEGVVIPFFNFLVVRHFANCLKKKPSNRTKIRFPVNAVSPTANGCNPHTIPSGTTIDTSIHGAKANKNKT